jgi:hypothetical protein
MNDLYCGIGDECHQGIGQVEMSGIGLDWVRLG